MDAELNKNIFNQYWLTIHQQYIYNWTPLCQTQLSRTPHYLEQKRIALRFALVFSVIYYGLSRTRLSRTPCYLELSYFPKKHWSKSVRKCSQGTLWQDVLKAVRNIYWRVHCNESKVRLTGPTTANAEGDKLPVFVNFRDQTITPEIWRQPHYLEPPLSRTVSWNPWGFEIEGFYCIYKWYI